MTSSSPIENYLLKHSLLTKFLIISMLSTTLAIFITLNRYHKQIQLNQLVSPPQACPQDLLNCPDGSTHTRIPPTCTFPSCATPPASKQPILGITTTYQPLLTLSITGGNCSENANCETLYQISSSGEVLENGTHVQQISPNQLRELTGLINTTDFTALQSATSNQVCQITPENPERTYVFNLSDQQTFILSNCTHQLDSEHPLFLFVHSLVIPSPSA